MTDVNPEARPTGRSRARRNVVGRSPNRQEYVRLLENGWSSLTLERYAAYRYGEDIPASTFRQYKARQKIEATVEPLKSVDPDQLVDVIGKRAELIRLQEKRIAIDVQHELTMAKLFGSTRAEIGMLNSLLEAHKADLQDLGLLPKAGEKVTIDDRRSRPSAGEVPRAKTLGELFGDDGMDPQTQSELARVLHMASKSKKNGAASNGHAVG